MSRKERRYTSAPAAAAEAQAAAEEVAPAAAEAAEEVAPAAAEAAEEEAAAAAEALHSKSEKSVVFSNGALFFDVYYDSFPRRLTTAILS